MPPKIKKEEELTTQHDNLKLQQIALTTTVEDLLESGSLPPGVDTKEKIMTIAQYGKELGMDPLTAINSISLVKGRMVIGSSMLGALLKRHGYEYLWNRDWHKDEGGKITTEVEIFWHSKTLKREMSQKFQMSWQELELTGLTTRDTYQKYPKAMLRKNVRLQSVMIERKFRELLENPIANKQGQSAAKFNSNVKKVQRLGYGVLKEDSKNPRVRNNFK